MSTIGSTARLELGSFLRHMVRGRAADTALAALCGAVAGGLYSAVQQHVEHGEAQREPHPLTASFDRALLVVFGEDVLWALDELVRVVLFVFPSRSAAPLRRLLRAFEGLGAVLSVLGREDDPRARAAMPSLELEAVALADEAQHVVTELTARFGPGVMREEEAIDLLDRVYTIQEEMVGYVINEMGMRRLL